MRSRFVAAAALLLAAAGASAQTTPGDECPPEPEGAVGGFVRSIDELTGRRFRAGLGDCPPGTGFRPLSSVHPAKEVFVGSYPNAAFAAYAKSMVDAIARVAPDVNVNLLVHPAGESPAGFTGNPALFDFVRGTRYAERVRVVEASGDPRGGQWPQDAFEAGVTGANATPATLELYRGGARGPGGTIASEGNGQGGDLEAFPGGVVVTGSRTAAATKRLLTEGSGEAPVEIDTSWLRVGHVDELFQVVPTNGAEPCGFAILHASPAAGIELAMRLPDAAPLEPSTPAGATVAETHGTRVPSATGSCLEDLPKNAWGEAPLTAGAARACPEFTEKNLAYDAKIQEALAKIRAQVAAKTGCAEPPAIAVPQLFRPGGIGGTGAGVEAVNPNAVNSLVLGRAVIAAEQPNDLFRNEIRKRFTAQGVRVEWVDARMFHFNGGTVHCSTNAIRACE